MSLSLEETFEAACKAKEIPGAVLLAEDLTGNFHYEKSFGVRSLKDPESGEPIGPDDIMWIASCTKLMTCIAALQCVEQGKLHLDADVTSILPELKDMDILKGFDKETGKPITTKATKTITLRMLLTHSSGMSYDVFNPILMKWRASQGQSIAPGRTIVERFDCPLLFEPGTAWGYSPSIDWAGKMVERVNDNIGLEDYMRIHIWEPLGIKDITFSFHKRPDLGKRLISTSLRDPGGSGKVIHIPHGPWDPNSIDDAMGGGGGFSSPREYFKVVKATLHNDGTLLKPEFMEEFFKPQLSESSHQAIQKCMHDPEQAPLWGGVPPGTKIDYSLSGMLVLEDLAGWRRKGCMNWSGLPMLQWVVDRKAGLCMLYSSQVVPQGDLKSVEMIVKFERTMYERGEGATSRI